MSEAPGTPSSKPAARRNAAGKPAAARKTFRKLDGILLLDKPQGLSSNQALQRVRHLFRADKAGHTGSLDPLATGLLPVCFGEATTAMGVWQVCELASQLRGQAGPRQVPNATVVTASAMPIDSSSMRIKVRRMGIDAVTARLRSRRRRSAPGQAAAN